MPFIPHTQKDIEDMLELIGAHSIDELFSEIPASLKKNKFVELPPSLDVLQLKRLMQTRSKMDGDKLCFIGAGAYEHHIPAAVWDIASRGEYMTAYTPYQAEASQGSLQLIYEYQTMMSNLMGMDVSNASLYDGASALAEAVLMAIRIKAPNNKMSILMPKTVNPYYRMTVQTIVQQQGIKLIEVPYDSKRGVISLDELNHHITDDVAALVIPQPNFFGLLEDVDLLTDWCNKKNILVLSVVNPMAMAILNPPGAWGSIGADIACGEGQPLGIPLASGGPYYGFFCCRKNYVRQMPGRVVGRTVDREGKEGFVLTLQAREQHIRRAKATSNICTNQGLMVTASTIYMSLMGVTGLQQIAYKCHDNAIKLRNELQKIKGLNFNFTAPFYQELVIKTPVPTQFLLSELAKEHIQAGYNLKEYYPELGESMMISVTETKTQDDIQKLTHHLKLLIDQGKIACHA